MKLSVEPSSSTVVEPDDSIMENAAVPTSAVVTVTVSSSSTSKASFDRMSFTATVTTVV